jgi:glutaredoxin-related protein
MKYNLYYDNQCATCKEFIKIFNNKGVDVTLKDIEAKVEGFMGTGAYRWEQIDLSEEFGHGSAFIPMLLIEDNGIRKLFAGGTDEDIIRNTNENLIIFTSHEDGVDKLTKMLKNEKVN